MRSLNTTALVVLLTFFGITNSLHFGNNRIFNKYSTRISNSLYSDFKPSTTYLSANPLVGDVVVGEVDDISGTLDNPFISLKIKSGKDVYNGKLPTKSLTPIERMTFQTGSVLQVQIAEASKNSNELIVSLPKKVDIAYDSKNSRNSRINVDDDEFKSTSNSWKIPTSPSPRASTEKADSTRKKSSSKYPQSSQPYPTRTYVKSSRNLPVTPLPAPEGSLLLNNLKTGTKLTGVVASCTLYAAYIDVNVYRKSKGESYTKMNGMLHFSDFTDRYLLETDRKANSMTSMRNNVQLLTKGSPVTVYVKEVMKQAGRFTVTMDSSITKSQILADRQKIKDEGLARRRSRRIRRRLQHVFPGDSVTGLVKAVIPEGVLVTLTSLGPLNITGMIGTRDLPKQFQIPDGLNEKYQKQLLLQDFMIGRQVVCGVEKVNPKWNPRMQYNLKLAFENFDDSGSGSDGSKAYDLLSKIELPDDVTISDADYSNMRLSNDDDDDTAVPGMYEDVGAGEYDDSDDFMSEEELEEEFSELSGGKDTISVKTFKQWDEIQGLLEDELIAESDIDEVVARVLGKQLQSQLKGVKGKKDMVAGLNLAQFTQVYASLEEIVNENAGISDDDSDDDDSDDNEDEYDDVEDSEEAYLEDMKMIYDELKGASSAGLSVDKYKNWEEYQIMENDGVTDDFILQELLKANGVGAAKSKQLLNFEQFKTITEELQNNYDDLEEDDDDDDDNDSINAESATADESDEGDEADGLDEDDDQSYEEALQEAFIELKGKDGKVSVKAFKEWEEVKDMVEEGITDDIIAEALADAEVKGSKMDFDQFVEVFENLQDTVDGFELDGSSNDNDEDEEKDDANNSSDDEEYEDDEQSYEEALEEAFNKMKAKDGKVPVKAFKEWEEVKDLLEDGLITNELIDEVLASAEVKGNKMNFEEFVEVFEELQDAADGEDGDDEDDEEGGDDDYEAAMLKAYDDIKGKDGKVTVKAFKEWDEMQGLMEEGVTEADLKTALAENEVKGSKMDYDQFVTVFDALQDIADDLNDDEGEDDEDNSSDNDDEDNNESKSTDEYEDEYKQALLQAYDGIKGKDGKVTVKAFKQWEEVAELIEEGVIDDKLLNAALKEANVDSSNKMDFEQFINVFEDVQDAADLYSEKEGVNNNASADDDDDDDNTDVEGSSEQGSEDVDEGSYEEALQDAFDELKGKDGKVTVKAFKEWEEVQSMVDDKLIDSAFIAEVLADASKQIKNNKMDFDTFSDVFERLQDQAYGDEEDEESDEEDEEGYIEALQTEFDKMKGKDGKVTVKAFKEWEEVAELMQEANLDLDVLVDALAEAGVKGSKMDFEQFVQVFDSLQVLADDEEGGDEEEEEEEEEQPSKKSPPPPSGPSSDKTGSGGGKGFQPSASTGKQPSPPTQSSPPVKSGAKPTMKAESSYSDLKDAKGLVSMAKITAMPLCKGLLADGSIDPSTLDILIAETGASLSKGGLNENQFNELCRMLHEYTDALDDDPSLMTDNDNDSSYTNTDSSTLLLDDTDEDDLSDSDDDISMSGDDLSDEDIEKLLKSIFDDMKNTKTNKVAIKKVLEMDSIKDAIENEEMTEKDVLGVLNGMNLKIGNEIDFPTFSSFLDSLEQVVNVDDDEDNDRSSNIDRDDDDEEEDDEDDLSEDEKLAMMKEVFNELKSNKSDKMSVKQFKSWENVQLALDSRYLTADGLDGILNKVCATASTSSSSGGNGFGKKGSGSVSGTSKERELDFDQFVRALDLIEEALNFDEVKDEELVSSSGKGDASNQGKGFGAATATAPSSASVPVSVSAPSSAADRIVVDQAVGTQWAAATSKASAAHPASSTLTDSVAAAAVTPSGKGFGKQPTIDELTAAAGGKKQRPLTADQVQANAVAKEIFDDLRGVRKTLSVETFRKWEDVTELLASGALKQSSLERAIAKVGAYDNGEMNLEQFLKLIDIIQKQSDATKLSESYEKVSGKQQQQSSQQVFVPTEGSGGTGRRTGSREQQEDEDLDHLTQLITSDEVDSDITEEELASASVDEEEATREVFNELLEKANQNNIKNKQNTKGFKNTAGGSGSSKLTTLPLVEFIQWEDVQELLETGSLSKDDLASAIERTGVTVESGDLTFETFYDLVRIIDDYIDQDKLTLDQGRDITFQERVDMDLGAPDSVDRVVSMIESLADKDKLDQSFDEGEDSDDDDEESEYIDVHDSDELSDDELVEQLAFIDDRDLQKHGLKLSYTTSKGRKLQGSAALDEMQREAERAKKAQEQDEQEVVEMFNEISKGKSYITEKQLRKWDELLDTVDAGFIDMKTVDGYIKQLNIPANGQIGLELFMAFMEKMDRILVDDAGNMLGLDEEGLAVDLDGMSDDDLDDDDEE